MIAASHKMICAVVVGVVFLAGGLMMVFIVPSPIWFIAADIGLAYIPAAVLGGKLAMRR